VTHQGYPAPEAKVAQSVEHSTENAGVAGSIPALGTNAIRVVNWKEPQALLRQAAGDFVTGRLQVRILFEELQLRKPVPGHFYIA
jgi:hypothetical protein